MTSSAETPRFEELPFLEGTEERHAWDVWGRDDQVGSLNRITPEHVVAAAGLVRRGKVINLDLPLNEPDPPLNDRARFTHHIESNRTTRDDHLDGFFLQGSSQWDALSHVRYRQHGFWGGREEADLERGDCGIQHWAQRGIVGRGVLIDAKRYFDGIGQILEPDRRFPITGDHIDVIAEAQGVEIRTGDVLLLRTGWLAWLLSLDLATRESLKGSVRPEPDGMQAPGLDGRQETAAWLWNRGIAAIAADNHALEALQVISSEGFQHRRLLPMLGIGIGEYWDLEELGDDCAEDGVYEFLLTSSPLNLTGGVGSPPNAYAIK